jgi:hypothetical protein
MEFNIPTLLASEGIQVQVQIQKTKEKERRLEQQT